MPGRAVVLAAVCLGAAIWIALDRGSDDGCAGLPSGAACTRVLFIGDSFTYVNNLPGVFASLSHSGGEHVATGMLASGGATLADQVSSAATATTISKTRWTVVVMQEQSEIPASVTLRQSEMYPAADRLVAMVRADGAIPMLFLTWGHKDGWPQYDLPTYASMQIALDGGYHAVADSLDVPVAPVGDAWSSVSVQDPQIGLWQSDGVHPTSAGTYLAACVFYAAIFRRSPIGLKYHDGLPPAQATELQQAAEIETATYGAEWHL
jgi:hypothetical protein